ncbi:MAG: hypothetical protein KDE50_38880, partial [Caldilineaceae bacterium]|nr:hypothetical protein [Caldilineaceae bacterium]
MYTSKKKNRVGALVVILLLFSILLAACQVPVQMGQVMQDGSTANMPTMTAMESAESEAAPNEMADDTKD